MGRSDETFRQRDIALFIIRSSAIHGDAVIVIDLPREHLLGTVEGVVCGVPG